MVAAAPSLAFQVLGETSPLQLFTAEEIEGFKTLQDIGNWAQVPPHVMEAFFAASSMMRAYAAAGNLNAEMEMSREYYLRVIKY